jgi:DNA-nicking Smr family endonuclease
MVTNNKRRREGGPPRRHRQLQGMWSCWHEGDKKREQGLALLKKAEEILASKNNRAKIVATRAQCATTHKMHICRERYNSRIQSKTKTQRESTRMHRAKVAQSCAAQKGANPPKRKVSEQRKDVVSEKQNAPRKCINEYVATKKQGRSRYAREDPSKLPQTRYCECRLCLLGFLQRRATSVLQDVLRACNKTRYECATTLGTSVQ